MARIPLAIPASFLALAAATPAHAQQNFYLGLGVEHGWTEMDDAVGGKYDGDLTALDVLGGARFWQDNYFFGAEVETTLATDYNTDSFTGDDLDHVTRLRGLFGYDFGDITGFVAAGGTWVNGPLAGPGLDDSADGWNLGIGGEYDINDMFSVRLEAIHDHTDFENGSYEWHNTSIRAAAIVRF
ncbi:MAG: outer membrane beta-barrel protein [Alphaproteobacteria bacterium]|nr:outer membrane beta-barrel protein [Alphaproteobacteria bacterium]